VADSGAPCLLQGAIRQGRLDQLPKPVFDELRISPWETSWLGDTLFAATLAHGKPGASQGFVIDPPAIQGGLESSPATTMRRL
jgi:hypothetical protein